MSCNVRAFNLGVCLSLAFLDQKKQNSMTDSLLSSEMLLHYFKTNVYSILYIFFKCIIKTEHSSHINVVGPVPLQQVQQ